MAIEDAAALGALLTGLQPDDSLEQRLRLFQEIRLPRANTTQILSDANLFDSVDDMEIQVRRFYRGPLKERTSNNWDKPVRDFVYGYDVFKQCSKALEYQREDGTVAEGILDYFYQSR